MVLPACASTEPAELEHGVLGGLFYASLAHNFTIRGPGAVNGAGKACHKQSVFLTGWGGWGDIRGSSV